MSSRERDITRNKGRPRKRDFDENAPCLTSEERRKVRRRNANREAVRRNAARAKSILNDLQAQVEALRNNNHGTQLLIAAAQSDVTGLNTLCTSMLQAFTELTAEQSRLNNQLHALEQG